MKTLVEVKNGFSVFFEALPEDSNLSDLLPEHTEKELQQIELNNVVFCAKISIEKAGIELSVDYLGGCIYEAEEEFYTTYKKDYYNCMVEELMIKAREEVFNLINKLQE